MPIQFDVVRFFTERREYARLLRPGETIPPALDAAFDLLGKLDPSWVWVLDIDGKIEGVLIASECHGAAMLWRVSISPDASSLSLVRLLRAFIRDIRKRGLKGYLTIMSPERDNERRLIQIMERAGGRRVGEEKLVMMAAPIPREGL